MDAMSSAETPILLASGSSKTPGGAIREIRQNVTAVTATTGASREIARA
jgi:hypothetical protein